ncbi:MAG: HAD family phosphatase [Candidatus Methanoplasma sp.]|jgi:phosphoserine phosphatase|nr:HAD family phosphatase [Candidatus Methanoplasma sp.]
MKECGLVCFDMDGTLTDKRRVRSSWRWIHDCLGVDNEATYRAFVNGEIGEREFMRRDIASWKEAMPGISARDLAKMFRDMPLIGGIQETVSCLRDNGIACAIISGGVGIAAEMLAREFGFDAYVADGVVDGPDGTLAPEGIMNVDLRGEDPSMSKAAWARRYMERFGTDRDGTASVGDSFTDIGMFEASGLSIAFNADEITESRAMHSIRSGNLSDILDLILDGEGHSSNSG